MERARAHEDGFALLELVAVLIILAVLLGIAFPAFMKQREQADDMATKLMLTTAMRGEVFLLDEDGGYTADADALAGVFPEYDFSGAAAESIHLSVGDVEAGDRAKVMMYARSETGAWLGIVLVLHGDAAGRHTCISESELDMTIAACTGTAW